MLSDLMISNEIKVNILIIKTYVSVHKSMSLIEEEIRGETF